MTRSNSLDMGRLKTPPNASAKLMRSPMSSLLLQAPTSPSSKSPRNPLNTHWVHEQQRKTFVHHLAKWSLNHDSSPHFHGNISLSRVAVDIGLGKSVTCILTDVAFTDARKTIVVRLFPPQENLTNRRRDSRRDKRHDSMDPFGPELNFSEWQRGVSGDTKNDGDHEASQHSKNATNGCYKLVVRCGAGWISAREYFSKLYFNHLEAQKAKARACKRKLDDSLKVPSGMLAPPPASKDTVTIRPLFHPFRRLPLELQEMILSAAAGHTRAYSPCHDLHLVHKSNSKESSPISLSTMFRISKALNEHLFPYVYHCTDFHFGLTGFTNFLWQSGPMKRPEIRRLTFHFGKLALLHCIRWLAPDPVFDLLEPPVVTNPPSLQYFWRCQIQDLVRDLHLITVTINIKGIPSEDVPMVARILQCAFGSVERTMFVDTDEYGNFKKVDLSDALSKEVEELSWKDMCEGYWKRYRQHQYFFKWDLIHATTEDFKKGMDGYQEFFDGAT